VLYRTGYRGGFLGVGGTWNLNEEKNPDAEIVASGVFVGFFIYTVVILISYGFGSNHQKKTLVVSAHIIIYIYISYTLIVEKMTNCLHLIGYPWWLIYWLPLSLFHKNTDLRFHIAFYKQICYLNFKYHTFLWNAITYLYLGIYLRPSYCI